MEQYHRMYNGCRIPGRERDRFRFSFKTGKMFSFSVMLNYYILAVNEGDCCSHLLVISNYRLYRLDLLNEQGQAYSAPEYEVIIVSFSKSKKKSNLY